MENLLKKIWEYIRTRSPYIIVIVILMIILFFQKTCGGKKCPDCPEIDTITKVDTVYNTVTIHSPIYTPVPYAVHHTDTVIIPANVDTAAILADYFAEYYYADTLMDDTIAWLVVYDYITQNKVQAREWAYKNRQPTQVITNTTVVDNCKKWNIGVGIFVGGSKERFDAGVGGLLTTKKSGSYGIEFNPFDKSARVVYYWNFR